MRETVAIWVRRQDALRRECRGPVRCPLPAPRRRVPRLPAPRRRRPRRLRCSHPRSWAVQWRCRRPWENTEVSHTTGQRSPFPFRSCGDIVRKCARIARDTAANMTQPTGAAASCSGAFVSPPKDEGAPSGGPGGGQRASPAESRTATAVAVAVVAPKAVSVEMDARGCGCCRGRGRFRCCGPGLSPRTLPRGRDRGRGSRCCSRRRRRRGAVAVRSHKGDAAFSPVRHPCPWSTRTREDRGPPPKR